MANMVVTPVPSTTAVRFQQVTVTRPRFVYDGNVRTEEPKANAKGEPLYGFEATVNCSSAPRPSRQST